ncbi:MAG: NAD(P)-dependent oxidoreductase [Ardenticatenaceae bacterium]|nr:NAD(P)-dependent oxidoreductase [Ardenticatenaceae bacterium]
MRILVTGSEGRIGRRVVRRLLERGYRVRGYDQRAGPAGGEGTYELVQGHLLEHEKLEQAVADADVVVHLAGQILFDDRQARHIVDTNLRATLEVLEAMAHSGHRWHRAVLASSGQVYPDSHALYSPVDEDHPLQPDTYYGYAKQTSEAAAWFYQRKWAIPTVCLRFTHVQEPAELIDPSSEWSGPRFFLNVRLAALRRSDPPSAEVEEAIRRIEAVAGEQEQLLLSRGPDGRPYEMTIAHPDDIASGILLAIERDEAVGQVYNLGPAGSFNFGEVIPYMAKHLGLPYVALDLPLRPYHYQTSIAKARAQLGYWPRYDAFAMIDEAIAQRRGESKRLQGE